MDAYDRKARLYPVLIVLFPVSLLALIVFSSPGEWKGIVALAAACGLHILAMQFVRDRGFELQGELWASWGGSPAVEMLRWLGKSNLVKQTKRHADVQLATGIELPNRSQEASDPKAADEIYETAVGVLREHTRDQKQFPLVKAELGNYGFRRNLYGSRPIGIAVAAIVAGVEIVLALLSPLEKWLPPAFVLYLSAAAGVLALVLWIWGVNSEFVKRDAVRYADALIASATFLSTRGH